MLIAGSRVMLEEVTRLWLEQNAGRRARRENYDKNGDYQYGPPSPENVMKATQFQTDLKGRCRRYSVWCEYSTPLGKYMIVLYDPVLQETVFTEAVPEEGFPTDELIARIMLVAK